MQMKKNKKVIIVSLLLILFLIIVISIKIVKEKENKHAFPKTKELLLAKQENNDTVGWIYIKKTNIDYPIMWGEDEYYLDYSFEKEKVTSGSVHVLNKEKTQNIVITGHNSRVSLSKFNWLHNLRDVNLGKQTSCYEKNNFNLNKDLMPNFENNEDQIWYISIYGLEGKWQIWSMYETPPDESIDTYFYNTWLNSEQTNNNFNKEKIDLWIDYQLKRSEYNFNTKVNNEDQFITIFTCGCQYYDYDHNSKLYFFLKKI